MCRLHKGRHGRIIRYIQRQAVHAIFLFSMEGACTGNHRPACIPQGLGCVQPQPGGSSRDPYCFAHSAVSMWVSSSSTTRSEWLAASLVKVG